MAQPFSVFRDPPARFDVSRPQMLPLPACFSQKASANLVWSHPGNLPGAGQTDAKFDPVFAERIGVSGEWWEVGAPLAALIELHGRTGKIAANTAITLSS